MKTVLTKLVGGRPWDHLDAFSSLVASSLLFAMMVMTMLGVEKLHSADEIRSLINEMTTTPERQQKALDQLAELDDRKLGCLLRYFNDERRLASEEVKFLNSSPVVGEKYYLTGGEKINQAVIQYFCWRTGSCSLSSGDNIEEVRRQIKEDVETQKKMGSSTEVECMTVRSY